MPNPRTVVCIHIQCTQGDNPEQRAWLGGWLKDQLEAMNYDGTLTDNAFIGEGQEQEGRIANTAIAITVEERE